MIDVMLTHKYRFHGHGSLRYLFHKGQTARTRNLMLRYTPNAQRVHSRVAIVVSKKVFKSAAKRNRVRRRLFEIVRHDFESIKGTYDFTITVFSPEVITLPHEQLQHEVRQLLVSAHITEQLPPKDKSLSSWYTSFIRGKEVNIFYVIIWYACCTTYI